LDALRYEPHATHFTIEQALVVAAQIGAEQTYFIHMTHAVEHDEVNARLPPGVALAYDGLEVPFR
jgi:phosphoribosyl 1,2-cyclic phosphate phosphodiesterase